RAARLRVSCPSASSFGLVGKRPEPQLLFGYLPEPRQSVRLDDQKEDDETAEHHQLELLLQGDRQAQAHGLRRVREEDRHQYDEGGAEEGSEDRAEAADDHHEQDEEGQRDVEGQRLGTAEVEKDELRARDATVERADAEGEQLRPERPD